ncbi:MAG: hypothetical protein WDZ51_16955, partial [Pirellulaceae bacterium]
RSQRLCVSIPSGTRRLMEPEPEPASGLPRKGKLNPLKTCVKIEFLTAQGQADCRCVPYCTG